MSNVSQPPQFASASAFAFPKLPQDNAADPSIKREISHLTLLNSSRIRIRHLETNQSAPPPRGWVWTGQGYVDRCGFGLAWSFELATEHSDPAL